MIDISARFEPGRSEADKEEVLEQILKYVTSNAGSFFIVGHGVDDDLMKRLEATSQDFFTLDIDEKKQYRIDPV